MNRPAPVSMFWLVLAGVAAFGVDAAVQVWRGQAVVAEIREGFRGVEEAIRANRDEITENRAWSAAVAQKLGIAQAEIDRLRGDVP